jgi:hypothetical protein
LEVGICKVDRFKCAAKKDGAQPLTQGSGRFRELLLKLSLAMAGTSSMMCSVVGCIIHLYATILAFLASGYVAALLTFIIPFFAELYWIVTIWSETGVFWHGLTIASVAYFVLCITAIMAGVFAASAPD